MDWSNLPKAAKQVVGGILGLFFASIVVLVVWTSLPTRLCYPQSPVFHALQCHDFFGKNYPTFGDFLASAPPTLMYVLGLVGGAIFAG